LDFINVKGGILRLYRFTSINALLPLRGLWISLLIIQYEIFAITQLL